MPTVFVSHRKADAIQAEHLASQLKAAGHQVWFDEWEITIGDSMESTAPFPVRQPFFRFFRKADKAGTG